MAALIVLWKVLRKWERRLPFGLGQKLLEKPSRQIRLLRVLPQAAMPAVPKAVWFSTHVRQLRRQYYLRNMRQPARPRASGRHRPDSRASGVSAHPRKGIGGWPGWLTVSEATERVEVGWRRGLFSTDAHLKNFGVIGDRVVLIDPGGLTNRWTGVERHLSERERTGEPHVRLGLGPMLEPCPEVAQRFNARWRAFVNVDRVMDLWPG